MRSHKRCLSAHKARRVYWGGKISWLGQPPWGLALTLNLLCEPSMLTQLRRPLWSSCYMNTAVYFALPHDFKRGRVSQPHWHLGPSGSLSWGLPCALQYPTPLLTSCQQHPSSYDNQMPLNTAKCPQNNPGLRITGVDTLTLPIS